MRLSTRPPAIAKACLLLFTYSLAACSDSDKPTANKPAADPMAVRVAPAQRQTIAMGVSVTGTLFPNESITISAKVSGRITSYKKDVGERAGAAEELAQIDLTDYALEATQREMGVTETLAKLGLSRFPDGAFDVDAVPTVKRAAQQSANARARYDRIKQLHNQTPPLVSDQDFADVETTWQVSESELEVARLSARALLAEANTKQAELLVARQRLNDTRVLTPEIASTGPTKKTLAVAERLIAQGDYVREGDALFRLVDDNPLRLRLLVPERHAGKVIEGQSVRITVQSHDRPFDGRVTRISPQIDQESRTYLVEAEFDNSDRSLKPGAFATAVIVTEPQTPAVFVPRDAIVSFAGISRVFTAHDGKAVEARVETGETRGDTIQIATGLSGDEQIILAPPSRMVNGSPITIQSAAPTP